MEPMRAVVVDDEMMSRGRLRRLLGAGSKGRIEVIAECVDVDDLLRVARETDIDVVFLDIEMPGGDGFSGLRRWVGPRPMVVFVTAYEAHGVRAFDAGAVDYLMKPVSAGRLEETLDRLQKAAGRAQATAQTDDAATRKIPLALGQRTRLVPEGEILMLQASGNYVEVRTGQGVFVVRRTLAAFLGELATDGFVQLHRSVAVRRDAVVDIRPIGSGRYRIGLRGGSEVVSGRRFQDAVREMLKSPPRDGAAGTAASA